MLRMNDELMLVEPSEEYFAELAAYRNDFLENSDSMDGCGPLRRFDDMKAYLEDTMRYTREDILIIFYFQLSFFFCHNFALFFVNAVCRNESTYRGKWIDVAVISNNCSRVQNASASYFYFISEHCTKLLHACLNLLFSGFYHNKFLI